MIYYIEDDDDIRELMIYTMKTAGFEANGFVDGLDFWKAVEKKIPELILLDIMLPKENGIEILKKIRRNSSIKNIPVIMATAKGTEYDKVKSLDLGADDYLVKPFGMMEMISRIKAILRRIKSHEVKEKVLESREIKVVLQEYSAFYKNKKLDLTLKEFDLLVLFLSSPKRVFTRQELLNLVWGETFLGETRTVDVHIATLRLKLGEAGVFIKTVRGVGSKLEVPND